MLHRSTKKIFTENTSKTKTDSYLGNKCDDLFGLEISQGRMTVTNLWNPTPLLKRNYISAPRDKYNIKGALLPLSDLCFYMNFRLTNFFPK